MRASIEDRLPALFDSAKGGPEAPLAVYRRLQLFARAMRGAPAGDGSMARLVWFDEHDQLRSITIGLEAVTIGRDSACEVVLQGTRVSRKHCVLRTAAGRGGAVEIEDLRSSNGTVVNGERIATGAIALRDGDVIEVGGMALAVVGARSEGGLA